MSIFRWGGKGKTLANDKSLKKKKKKFDLLEEKSKKTDNKAMELNENCMVLGGASECKCALFGSKILNKKKILSRAHLHSAALSTM